MKRYAIRLFISVVVLLGLVSFIYAQESSNDFTLVNKTGYVISKVFVGPTKSEDWGEDILGKDTLNDGESVLIKFHPNASTELYDIKVVYKVDNTSAIWYGYDLTKIEKITIRYDSEKDKTTAEVE